MLLRTSERLIFHCSFGLVMCINISLLVQKCTGEIDIIEIKDQEKILSNRSGKSMETTQHKSACSQISKQKTVGKIWNMVACNLLILLFN